MIKILWMLYLAFTLITSMMLIYNMILSIAESKKLGNESILYLVLVPLLWSIWYFYYLN